MRSDEMPPINKEESGNSPYITGLILAGGEGTRMQGLDKGLQMFKGQPLIEHVIGILTKQVDELLISANRNLPQYQTLGFEVITDLINLDDKKREVLADHQGPMAGIAAGLRTLRQHSRADYLAVSSCDTPMLPSTLVPRLFEDLVQSKANVAVAHDGQRPQNLHCLIKRCAWSSLIESFNNGERAMHRWQRANGSVEVDFSDCPEAFANMNTLSALA